MRKEGKERGWEGEGGRKGERKEGRERGRGDIRRKRIRLDPFGWQKSAEIVQVVLSERRRRRRDKKTARSRGERKQVKSSNKESERGNKCERQDAITGRSERARRGK